MNCQVYLFMFREQQLLVDTSGKKTYFPVRLFPVKFLSAHEVG
jgi:hypothetical protein